MPQPAWTSAAAWPAPVKWVQKPIAGELQLPTALAGSVREKVRKIRGRFHLSQPAAD